MSHPIHQANENNPYGDLTREEFYKKHQILHEKSFILNKKNMKIFTQSWRPDPTHHQSPLKGLVAMIHGYTCDSSWVFDLTCVAIAKAGFFVCALDLQGHGFSQGSPGSIPHIEPIVNDCIQYFNLARSNFPKLPSFLYGESLGGAIAILIALKQKKSSWDGLILSGSMCGISPQMKPIWPLEILLPMAKFFVPSWKIVVSKPLASRSYKEEWKRRLVSRNPNRRASGRPDMVTGLEFLRVCYYIRRNCHKIEVPLLMVHGEDDVVCDGESARFVFESAASEYKVLKIFPGMWHQLIGESKENVDHVFGIIFSWLVDRAERVKNGNTK